MGFLARVFGSMSGFTALDKATQNALDEIAARASQGLSEFTITIRESDVPRLPLDHTVTAITEAIQDNGHSVLSTRKEVRSGVARLLVRPAPPGTVPARTTGGTRSAGVIATIGLENKAFAMAVSPETNSLFVSCWEDSAISVIDTLTNRVKVTIPLSSTPGGVVVDPAIGNAYVVVGYEVWVIDTHTNEVVTTVNVKAHGSIAINPSTHTAYLTNYPRSITVFDTRTCQVTDTLTLGGNYIVIDVEVDPATNQAYALMVDPDFQAESTEIWVIDTTNNQVKTRLSVDGALYHLTVDSNGRSIYATKDDYGLAVIDTVANRVRHTIPVTLDGFLDSPRDVAINPVTKLAYVTNKTGSSVWVVDIQARHTIDNIKIGGSPDAVCVDTSTGSVFVATGRQIRVIPLSER